MGHKNCNLLDKERNFNAVLQDTTPLFVRVIIHLDFGPFLCNEIKEPPAKKILKRLDAK